MSNNYETRDPSARVAAGVKTALIVCVVGFVALAANRAIVGPGGVSAADAMHAPAAIAPDQRAPTLSPVEQSGIASSRYAEPNDSASPAASDGDNHPASF